jgi:hypothetical protein
MIHRGLGAALGQPHVLRAVLGAGLFLCVSGLLAFGLGALLRYTAGAVTMAIAVLFLPLPMSAFLPDSWQASVQVDPLERGQPGVVYRQRPVRAHVLALGRIRRLHRIRGHRDGRRAGGIPVARRLTRAARSRSRVELQEEPGHIALWPDQISTDQEQPPRD